jgi:hypothetical protein
VGRFRTRSKVVPRLFNFALKMLLFDASILYAQAYYMPKCYAVAESPYELSDSIKNRSDF